MIRTLLSSSVSSADFTDIEKAIAAGSGEEIYRNKEQSIIRFQAAGRDLISKTYLLQSAKQKLAALLGNSRARRSFRAARQLVSAGIPTPQPIFLKEEGSILPHTSVLVTKFCDYSSLFDQIYSSSPIHTDTLKNILRILHQLRSVRCAHGDFHARNLLISPEGRIQLIDLDGMRFTRSPSRANRLNLRDRDRLLRSVEPLPHYHSQFSKILGAHGEPLPGLSSQPPEPTISPQ